MRARFKTKGHSYIVARASVLDIVDSLFRRAKQSQEFANEE